jgi:hypothetical protein
MFSTPREKNRPRRRRRPGKHGYQADHLVVHSLHPQVSASWRATERDSDVTNGGTVYMTSLLMQSSSAICCKGPSFELILSTSVRIYIPIYTRILQNIGLFENNTYTSYGCALLGIDRAVLHRHRAGLLRR